MAHLIDKDALVAMIEKKIELNTKWRDGCETLAFLAANEAIEEDKQILSIINTLEVKEVDLNKKIEEYLSTYWSNEKELYPFLGYMAKHFFELGLKAQKGK